MARGCSMRRAVLLVLLAGCSGGLNIKGTTVHPVASAGPDVSYPLGTRVLLDGTHSRPSDSDHELGFAWSLAPPEGSSAKLDSAARSRVSFQPDVLGTYVIKLTVVESGTRSAPDE